MCLGTGHGAKARGLQTCTQVHVVECLQFNATISLSVSALEANVNTVVLRLLFCIDLGNRSHLSHLKETIVALVQLRWTNAIRIVKVKLTWPETGTDKVLRTSDKAPSI